MNYAVLLTISFACHHTLSKGSPAGQPTETHQIYSMADDCALYCYYSENYPGGTDTDSVCCPSAQDKCFIQKDQQGRYSQGCLDPSVQHYCDGLYGYSCCDTSFCNPSKDAPPCPTIVCYNGYNTSSIQYAKRCCPDNSKCAIAKSNTGRYIQSCVSNSQSCEDDPDYTISCCSENLCNAATKITLDGQLSVLMAAIFSTVVLRLSIN